MVVKLSIERVLKSPTGVNNPLPYGAAYVDWVRGFAAGLNTDCDDA